jgi:hypothetical protein
MHAKSNSVAIFSGLLLALLSLSLTAHGQAKDSKSVIITNSGETLKIATSQPSVKEMGFSPYPGAQPKSEGKGEGAGVNLNMTTSAGPTKVQVMKFQTADGPEKVTAFYKKDLARYGNVLECRGTKSVTFEVNDPAHKNELKCDHEGSDPAATVIKAGRENSEHLVVVRKNDQGTEFTLIHTENSQDRHETL